MTNSKPLERWHIVARANLERNAKLLVLLLARWGKDCHPSQTRLALEMGFTERTIRRLLEDLERRGIVKWKRRGGVARGRGRNMYSISYNTLSLMDVHGDVERSNGDSGPDTAMSGCPDRPAEQPDTQMSGCRPSERGQPDISEGLPDTAMSGSNRTSRCPLKQEELKEFSEQSRSNAQLRAHQGAGGKAIDPASWRSKARTALIRIGVNPADAIGIVNRVPDSACVTQALQVLQQQQQNGTRIQSVPAFVRRAIEHRWTVNQ